MYKFTLPQVPITTDVVGSTSAHVIQFVSDSRQVNGFLQVLRFSPAITLTARI